MKKNKMTKQAFAKVADFSPYVLGKFTKGSYVSLKEIETLCELFHCKIEDLVEFIGN